MRTITVKIETDSEASFDLIKDDIEEELSCCWNWLDIVEISEEMKGDSDAPTVDVPDRKVGEWIWMGDKGDSRFMCSVCKSKENVPTIMGKPIVWDYCPNCGARMESKE